MLHQGRGPADGGGGEAAEDQGRPHHSGRNISLMTARCVGACGRAPVILEDSELVGLVEPGVMLEQLERWAAHD